MQGKITKVLNMKPVETLNMIEEAAGTKTYDIKKANSLATIDKKNSKLNEIERVLHEDISPMIEKLKQERSAYIEYQKCEREYLHLHKICIAHQYYLYDKSLHQLETDNEQFNENKKQFETRIEEINEAIAAIKEQMKVMRQNHTDVSDDSQLLELQGQLKEYQLESAKVKGELTNLQADIKTNAKKRSQVEKSINENLKFIEQKVKKLDEMKSHVETSEAAFVKAENELKTAQKLYEALCCGYEMVNEDGQAQTIQEQLLDIRNRISEQKTIVKQSDIKLKKCTEEYNAISKDLATSNNDYAQNSANYEKKKAELEVAQKELDKIVFDTQKLDRLVNQKKLLNIEINAAGQTMNQFYTRYPQLNFDFTNPEPNFDRFHSLKSFFLFLNQY
jgi:structural maintenance of chromosome 2